MKRGRPLKRTPMKRKTQLANTPEAKLKRRIRSMKPARTKYDPAEAPARKAVYGRSEGWCEIRIPGVCTGNGEEWHHRKNRSQGGPWAASNGIHACRGCHATVTEPRPEYLAAGWCVKQWQVPAAVPVRLHHGWVLLDNRGGYEPYLLKEAS